MTHESDRQKRIRRVRTDSRSDEEGTVVSYLKEDGSPIAWTGDIDAPYVHALLDEDIIVNTTLIPTASPINALDWDSSSAQEEQSTAKIIAGRIYMIHASNEAGTDAFLQLHNTNALLTGGEVPFFRFRIPANGGAGSIDYGVWGRFCSVGITWGASLTPDVFTADPGVLLWVDLGFK